LGGIGETEKAIEHQDKALKILEAEFESVELARLYDDMAHMYWRIGNTDKARLWAEKALEFAKRLNDNEIIATSCISLGKVFSMIGESKKAVEFMETALEIALDNNYLKTAARAYNNLASILPPDKKEREMECLEKAYELAKRIGEINMICFAGSNLAGNFAGAGKLDRALALSEESVALDRKTGNQNHLAMSLGELGNEYQILGELDKSEKFLREAFNIAQALKDYQAVTMSYAVLAMFYYDKGEYAKAKELSEKGYELVKKTGDKMMQWWYSYYITDICIELGEIEKAQSQVDNLYKSALEVEAKTGNKHPIAWAKKLKGKLLRAQGKWAESIEYFERSLQDLEAVNAKRWDVYGYAKRILLEYARVYLERDLEGDGEKADKLLNQALEMFQKMGAKKDIEKTMRLVENLHLPPTQIHEKEVSTESHEYTELLGNVIATPRELKVGESLELEIELTNTRKEGAILLTKILEVIPEGFTMVKKPELYRMEGDCLNMKEKQLDPLRKEEVKLVLTPKIQGTFQIKPRILYIDANGKEKTHEPKPASITVKELGIKGWLKGER
jgi:tetratricopeptide (TPR) repeat protein